MWDSVHSMQSTPDDDLYLAITWIKKKRRFASARVSLAYWILLEVQIIAHNFHISVYIKDGRYGPKTISQYFLVYTAIMVSMTT